MLFIKTIYALLSFMNTTDSGGLPRAVKKRFAHKAHGFAADLKKLRVKIRRHGCAILRTF
jgi:hypothetical protein